MDRRIVLAGLAAAVATPALAQTSSGSGAASGTMPGAASQAGAAMGQLGQAEQQYMQRTMMTGMVALETSQVALEKARHADVKMFAKFERDEQQTVSEVLRSMAEPAATASTASQSGAMAMPADKQEMMQKLRQAQGAEFDRMYVMGQIQGHQELLQIQEDYIKSGRNREVVNVARMARGHIKEHLEELQEIQGKLKG